MKRCQRHGPSLVQMLAVLPLITVGAVISVKVVTASLRAQTLTSRHANDRTLVLDITRRVQMDAANAAEVSISPTGDVTFVQGESRIVYRGESGHVERNEIFADESESSFEWTLTYGDVQWSIESTPPGGQLVWCTVVHRDPQALWTEGEHKLSLAAVVGARQ